MVLDSTYFLQGLTEVANQTTFVGGKSSTTGLDSLSYFITRYQKDFMYKLLGKTLADEYLLDASPAKWVALDALLFDTTLKVSPVANYVFYYYQQSTWQKNAGVGSVIQTAENSVIDNVGRMCDVWNQMTDLLMPALRLIMSDLTTYPVNQSDDADWCIFVNASGRPTKLNRYGI